MVLNESLQLVTFKNDGFDEAIRIADDQFNNLNSELIISLKIYALASPAYIAKQGRLKSIASPQGPRLFDYYDSKNISSQPVHWRDMVDGDLAEIEHEHLVYPDELQSPSAAVHGQGIALVPMYLCEDEIESGQLEWLSAEIYEYRNRY